MLKSIYEYRDYRKYLEDFYTTHKKEKRFFTYRYFAKKAGLASPMHLKLVMSGKRNISAKSLPKFVKGLGLKGGEARYLESLVFFCQAKTSENKMYYLDRLMSLGTATRPRNLKASEQKSLFSKWYYVPIFELIKVKDFEEDGFWISKKLSNLVTPAKAKAAVDDLIQMGLVQRLNDGKLRCTDVSVGTKDEIENLLIRQYHKKMMEFAQTKIDRPLDEREFGFVTAAASKESLQKLKPLIKEFLVKADKVLSESEPEPETDVFQLNLQLFKLTN